MTLHFFSASKLADDLAHARVTSRDKAYYMLAGSIFSIALGYSTLTFSNAGHTWFSVYEFLLLVVTTIYGFERCYNTSTMDSHGEFVSDFVCLTLPIGITTTIATWGIYWGGWSMYQTIVTSLFFDSRQNAQAIIQINNLLPRFTVLLAMVLSNGIFYLRMIAYLSRLKNLRQ